MPAHNIAHCNMPSGIAKRPRVYVPRIAADKCRAYAEFVRFIAKRDTCYGTRDTKAIAQRVLAGRIPMCVQCRAIIPRERYGHYFPQDLGKLIPTCSAFMLKLPSLRFFPFFFCTMYIYLEKWINL